MNAMLALSHTITLPMDQHDHSSAPPPYSHSQNIVPTYTEKQSEQFLPPFSSDEPGLAVASALSKGLQVPSRTAACSSGFDYPAELASYGVSKEQWEHFTRLIRDESKLSREQWTTVIGKGLGTLAIGGLMIGFLSAIPAAFVARNARKRQEQRNLIASMAGVHGNRLLCHISQWNEQFFRPRGILVRVDLPNEYIDEMKDMDMYGSHCSNRSAAKVQYKATFKARIVIIPLEGSSQPSRGSSTVDTLGRDWN